MGKCLNNDEFNIKNLIENNDYLYLVFNRGFK